jgi:hypothetical protein
MNDDLRIVRLSFPRSHQRGHLTTDAETWITMLEQLLLCHYDGYKVTVTRDHYHSSTNVEIEFASVEDATWFRLQQQE